MCLRVFMQDLSSVFETGTKGHWVSTRGNLPRTCFYGNSPAMAKIRTSGYRYTRGYFGNSFYSNGQWLCRVCINSKIKKGIKTPIRLRGLSKLLVAVDWSVLLSLQNKKCPQSLKETKIPTGSFVLFSLKDLWSHLSQQNTFR